MHAINETLRLKNLYMEPLPIAQPNETIRSEAEPAVTRLIEIAQIRHKARVLILDWLHTEFEVQEPGTRLEEFATLDVHAFVEEVRKRRPKSARKLTPAALKDLQDGYTEQIVHVQRNKTEALLLERKLSDLVNAAYGLTVEEIALLWATAPPRMPLPLPF
jgi:hypothetical protein